MVIAYFNACLVFFKFEVTLRNTDTETHLHCRNIIVCLFPRLTLSDKAHALSYCPKAELASAAISFSDFNF